MSCVVRRLKWIGRVALVWAGMSFASVSVFAFQPALRGSLVIDLNSETAVPQGVTHLNNDVVLRRWLKDARMRLDAGKVAEGLTLVQRILDRGDDGFVRLQSLGKLVEVRFEALRIVSSLSPNDRVIYEKLFGTQARQLFDRAKTTGHPTDATEVSRRFFHTAAGFEASRWLASRWLDHGEARTAARMWERILAEPVHQERITSAVRVQAAIAYRAAGNDRRANEVLGPLNDATLKIAGEPRDSGQAAEFVDTMKLTQRDFSTGEWLTPTGSWTRNAARSGSVPWLNPLWSAPLFTGPAEVIQQKEWLSWQEGHHLPMLAVAGEPVVVRDQVVVRDFQGISALELGSGRLVWRYRSRLPTGDVIRAVAQQSLNDHDLAKAVQEAFASNTALGTLSTDGRFVFAVEAVSADVVPPVMKEGDERDVTELFGDEQRVRVLTQLIALPIAPLDGTSADEASASESTTPFSSRAPRAMRTIEPRSMRPASSSGTA